MDITMIGRDCAQVTLTAHECRELDICYESFSPESITARLFLAAVIARLETLGAKIAAADKLTAEVFDNGSEGLVMYLSGKGMKAEAKALLSKFGASRLSEVKEDDYAALAAEAEDLLNG